MKNEEFEKMLKKHGNDLKEHLPAPNCLESEKFKMAEGCGDTEKKKITTHRKFYFSAATVAAMVCICLLGSMILGNFSISDNQANTTAEKNAFSVTVYAASENGEPVKEINVTQEEVQSEEETYILAITEEADRNFVTVYNHIGFKCQGENIKSVEFKTDNGFFAREEDNSFRIEKMGSVYSINAEDIRDESFVYWGMIEDITDTKEITADVSKISIDISATFNDGSIQTEKYLYDVNKGTLILNEK